MELSSNGNIPAPLAYSPEEVAERRRAKNRAANKAWYLENKEAIKARSKAYYQNNKEAIKAYYNNNKEACDARHKAWLAANPDYMKAWNAANKDKVKAYYEENKDKIAAAGKIYYENNKDEISAYYKNKVDETWQEVYKHLGTTCSCPTCIWPSKLALEVDHIIPRKKGPHSDAPRGGLELRRYIIKHQCWEDFQLLCSNCNKLKYRNGGTCNCGDPSKRSR